MTLQIRYEILSPVILSAGEKCFDVDEAKAKILREIEAFILKNRNGRTGNKIAYSYYTMFNYFSEDGIV